MAELELEIESSGARTSVGQSVAETANAIALHLKGAVRGPFIDAKGERQVVAPVVGFGEELVGVTRACLVAIPALRECVSRIRPASRKEPTLLVLAVDPSPPETNDVLVEPFFKSVRAWADARNTVVTHLGDALGAAGFSDLEVTRLPSGAAGGLRALDDAVSALQGRFRRVLWGGVTSACESPWIEWRMLRASARPPRLRSPLVVGEAAAFVCLRRMRPDGEPTVGATRVVGWSFAEDASVGAGRATTAAPLTDALDGLAQRLASRGALDRRDRPAPLVAVDLSDCRALATEWQMAMMRVLGTRGLVPETRTPSLSVGEVDAATLPLYVSVVAEELAAGQAGICATMNELPFRAAVALEKEARIDG